MQTTEESIRREKNIKRKAAILTLLVNTGLILLFIYVVAWAPPDPPIPQYGIEVNFGLDDTGSGEIQNKAPANDNESFDKAKPQPITPQPQEQPQPTPDPTPTPQPDPTPTQPPVSEPVVEQPTTNDVVPVEAESEESVETVVEQPKPEPPKPEETVKPTPTPQPETTSSPPKEEVNNPTPEEKTIVPPLPSSNGGNASDSGTADENQANNNGQGDEVGDQGDPQGNINADALLGSAGGGGGAALDMPGWKWDQTPNAKDSSTETGKVIFEIKIDDEGEVLSVKTLFRSVSKAVANVYQSAVLDLTFTPTTENGNPAPVTTGRVTFIITSK